MKKKQFSVRVAFWLVFMYAVLMTLVADHFWSRSLEANDDRNACLSEGIKYGQSAYYWLGEYKSEAVVASYYKIKYKECSKNKDGGTSVNNMVDARTK